MSKTEPTKSPRQHTPIPGMPCKQTPREPTAGPSGTQWSEDLFREPSQHNEPPIPSRSQSSESQVPSHEDTSTCEPEPEVAPTQSPEEPFACPATTHSIIIINNMPISSLHSHNEAWEEFTDFQPALMIPQAIVHDSINQILLEHCQLLHMIAFVDATYENELRWEFREELNYLLGQALEAYPEEDITGIVSSILKNK
ncbi:hypothetical protein O181_027865 [Austropuccinia psidii MF-1]|uniref:Uncharacterized protein n=1 Tax=Austropuccinia psidii MF-1 TaxID=1389203 RepID=A0A9Q3CS68_9BASI|nr:hypothetical protein [Austropuccinia psidii MF-1]